jgi:hypothetical protein
MHELKAKYISLKVNRLSRNQFNYLGFRVLHAGLTVRTPAAEYFGFS